MTELTPLQVGYHLGHHQLMNLAKTPKSQRSRIPFCSKAWPRMTRRSPVGKGPSQHVAPWKRVSGWGTRGWILGVSPKLGSPRRSNLGSKWVCFWRAPSFGVVSKGSKKEHHHQTSVVFLGGPLRKAHPNLKDNQTIIFLCAPNVVHQLS